MTISHQTSHFSLPRRLAIVACLIAGCVFTLRAMTTSVIATPTVAASAPRIASPPSASLGSPVHLFTKNIEDIQAGDLVLARDEHGSAIGLKPVKETYQRISHHLRHLTFETPDGKQQSLSTTDEHPFWSVTADEFVEAGSLFVGHSVTGPNGETQTLVRSAREEFPNGVPVFNFQVTDYHTYFVAESADKPVMLVHNANCDELAPKGALSEADRLRIQRFADKYNTDVHVVGSRASGTSRPNSDYDYILGESGGNSRLRQKARRDLPRGTAGGEVHPTYGETGIDVFNEPLDPTRPHITIHPNQPGG
jgi:hypothetical protein